MEKPTNAEEFCWLYACGCIDSRLQAGTLTKEVHNEAKEHLVHQTYPTPEQIRAWFPKPFAHLDRGETYCTLEDMQRYWRKTHCNVTENTPVCVGRVQALSTIQNIVFARLWVNEYRKKLIATNHHEYKLKHKDIVYVHGSIIAEPLSW